MFNSLHKSYSSTAQRAKTNQENEGLHLTNNKLAVHKSRAPGSSKQALEDVKNKLSGRSTSVGGFSNTKNSPFSTALTKRTTFQHEMLKPQKIHSLEGLSKSSLLPANKSIIHEFSKPQKIKFNESNEECSLDIDLLLDELQIPKPKPDDYGYSHNLFDFTNEEINDVMFQKIDECQESPKLYNDDFNLREIPVPRDSSFGEELPLCMTPDWETGNNSILDLFGDDNSCNSFASSQTDATYEEDELPDFFTFQFD